MRNILSGCGRGSRQSTSIKRAFFLSPFLKERSLLHGAESVIERTTGSGFTTKVLFKRKMMFLCRRCRLSMSEYVAP